MVASLKSWYVVSRIWPRHELFKPSSGQFRLYNHTEKLQKNLLVKNKWPEFKIICQQRFLGRPQWRLWEWFVFLDSSKLKHCLPLWIYVFSSGTLEHKIYTKIFKQSTYVKLQYYLCRSVNSCERYKPITVLLLHDISCWKTVTYMITDIV